MLGVSSQNPHELKWSQRVAYGVGHVMNDISCAMWFSYSLFYFEVVLRMPSSVAGTLIFLGQLGDVIASPIVGVLVDRYSDRKTWHLVGTLFLAFTFPPFFSNCPWMPDVLPVNSTNANETEVIIVNTWEYLGTTQIIFGTLYYAVLAWVFQTGYAIVQIAHLAIMPELTPEKSERTNLTAIRWTSNFITNIMVFLVSWMILRVTEGNKNAVGVGDTYKFRSMLILNYVIGFICTIHFHVVLRIPKTAEVTTHSKSTKGLKEWCKVVKEYFITFHLYQTTLIYCASRMVMTVSLIYLPLYLVETVENEPELIATVPLASYLASFLASLWVRQIRKCCTNKVNYIVGSVLCILGSIWIGWGITYTVEIFVIASLLGAGSCITGIASLSMCATLIGTDTENGGFVYSIVTVADKLLGGVVVILIEALKIEESNSSRYYQDVLAYGCGVSAIIGLIILITMYCNHRKSAPSE